MKKLILLFWTLILLNSVLAVPGDWWGKVSINGSSSVNGAIVFGLVEGVIKDQSIVGDYSPDYYLLHLDGSPSNNVSFKIYDMFFNQTVSWSVGNHLQFDLNVTTLPNGVSCNYAESCTGEYCVHNFCRSSSTYCGDGYCDLGESCSSCYSDCGSCNSGGGGSSSSSSGIIYTETTQECTPDWICKPWSNCSQNGIMIRACTDNNNCGTIINRPWTNSTCVYFLEEQINNLNEKIEVIEDKPDIQDILKKSYESEGISNIKDITKTVLFSQALELTKKDLKEFNKESYNFNNTKNNQPIIITEQATLYQTGGSAITIFSFIIEKNNASTNFELIENIPKDIASSASELIFYNNPQILKEDPVIKWSFEANENKRLAYGVKKLATKNPQTIVYYTKQQEGFHLMSYVSWDKIKELKDQYGRQALSLTLILILIIIMITGVKIILRKKKRVPKQRELKIKKLEEIKFPVDKELMPLYNYTIKSLKKNSQEKLIQKVQDVGWSDEDISTVFEAIQKQFD